MPYSDIIIAVQSPQAVGVFGDDRLQPRAQPMQRSSSAASFQTVSMLSIQFIERSLKAVASASTRLAAPPMRHTEDRVASVGRAVPRAATASIRLSSSVSRNSDLKYRRWARHGTAPSTRCWASQ